MADTKKVIGKVSLTPKGSYDPAATYERLDVIRYDCRGYIVLADRIHGVTPEDGENYMLLADKGDKGDTGDAGPQGEQGPKGDPGDPYTLPIAGPSQLGGVQPAAKTDAMTQAVGVDDAGALWTAPGGGSADKPWRLIRDITTEEDVRSITFDTDDSGNGFELDEIYICTNATNISTQTAAGSFFVNINGKETRTTGTTSPLSVGFGATGAVGRNWMWLKNLNPLIVLHGAWLTTNISSGKDVYCFQPDTFANNPNPHDVGEKISKVDIGCSNSGSTFAAGSRFLVYGR